MKCKDDTIMSMEEDKIITQREWDDLVKQKTEQDEV